MTDQIMAIGPWRTNAEMIADAVVPLGYLHKDWLTLDPTYGYGNWWKLWTPTELVGCDLDPRKSPIGFPVDFTDMPWGDESFQAVAYDPAYKLNGTPTSEKDERYGVHEVATRARREAAMLAGLTECERVLTPEGFLLAKCQDMVNGGHVRWQTDDFTQHAHSLGLRKVDALLFRSYRPQPSGRRQLTARRNYSTLLVFKKGKRH